MSDFGIHISTNFLTPQTKPEQWYHSQPDWPTGTLRVDFQSLFTSPITFCWLFDFALSKKKLMNWITLHNHKLIWSKYKCDNKINQNIFIFNTSELFSEKKTLWFSTLVGPIRENLELDTLSIQHHDNQLYRSLVGEIRRMLAPRLIPRTYTFTVL